MVLPSTVCERPPWYVCTTLHDTADPPRLLLLVNSHSCQQTHITGHGMRVLRYTHPPQAGGAGQLALPKLLSKDTHHWSWYACTALHPPSPSCWCWSTCTAINRHTSLGMVCAYHVIHYCHPQVGAGQLAQLSTDTHLWSWYVCTALHPPSPSCWCWSTCTAINRHTSLGMVCAYHVIHHCHPQGGAGQLALLSKDTHHWSRYACTTLHPPSPQTTTLQVVGAGQLLQLSPETLYLFLNA